MFVRSDAQSLNEDLKPCAVTSCFIRRSNIRNTMFESGLPVRGLGKTYRLSFDSLRTSFNISIQRRDSGIRCSRFVFILALGIVQVLFFNSISLQVAFIISFVWVADRTRNSKASCAALLASVLRSALMNMGISAYGNAV